MNVSDLARTHTCGALRAADMGGEATLLGWVHRVRDLGSLIFVDVRDRFGVTQVVARDDDTLLGMAKRFAARVRCRGQGHGRAPVG